MNLADIIAKMQMFGKQNFPLLFPSEMERISNLPEQQRQGMAGQSIFDLIGGMPVVENVSMPALLKLQKAIGKKKDLGSTLLTDIIQKEIYPLKKGGYKNLYFTSDAGDILGGATMSESPRRIFLDELAVDPQASGKGIGSEIMNAIINDAKSKNKKIVVFPANTGVHKFYEKFGFVRKSPDRWEMKP